MSSYASAATPRRGLIGVTERGDAGTDFSWTSKLLDPQWAGAILITKRMSPAFIQAVLDCPKPAIVHCTCTGNGGTWIEPNAPDYKAQLDLLSELIDSGFPAERTVLRIDPIIPTTELLGNSAAVLDYVLDKHIPVGRVRFSLLDQYPHVIARLAAMGRPKFYPDQNGRYSFHPSYNMKRAATAMLSRYPFVFESCAEDWAASYDKTKFRIAGCVSKTDLELMGLPVPDGLSENPQSRTGCHCLSCKADLLTVRKPCPNACVYCYWKN